MSEFQQQQQQPQQQQLQPQQPALVYPSTAAASQPPSHHHSNGSFGGVFIVLAVIVVISALACFLGRLCNRRVQNRVQNQRPKPEKTHGGDHGSARPKGKQPSLHPDKGGDVEFGIDFRSSSGKGKFPPDGNGGISKGKGNGNGHGNSFKSFENGGEIKHIDHHEVDFNFKAAGHA